MNIEEFTAMIKNSLEKIMGDEFTITGYNTTKNNNTIKHGVSIRPNDSQIAPTIYLDEYFQAYQDGQEYRDIINDILRVYSCHKLPDTIEPDKFADWKWVKDRLFCKLINAEKNAEQLSHIPHRNILDLAVIYCVYMGPYKDSFSSVTITNDHIKTWKITEKELDAAATANCINIMEWKYFTINDILNEMGVKIDDDVILPMYILSTTDRVNGAIVMTYTDKLHELANKLDSDLYILPSSVHEIIAIPTTCTPDPDALKYMVPDVNATQVANEEILSDSVYYFDRNTDTLNFAT